MSIRTDEAAFMAAFHDLMLAAHIVPLKAADMPTAQAEGRTLIRREVTGPDGGDYVMVLDTTYANPADVDTVLDSLKAVGL